jgi:glycosyltransferase involved in cell wall biosynthesis
LSQKYEDKEIICVDDGSTDGTLDIVSKFEDVSVIRQHNSGVSAARNAGLEKATGEFVVFLDHDDYLTADSLCFSVRELCNAPDVLMVFGEEQILGKDGKLEKKHHADNRVENEFLDYWDVLSGHQPKPSRCAFRKRAVLEIGGYRSFAIGEDLDLCLRLGQKGVLKSHQNLVVTYRRHSGQLSGSASRNLIGVLEVFKLHKDYIVQEKGLELYIKRRRHSKMFMSQYLIYEFAREVLRGRFGKATRVSVVFLWAMPCSLYATLSLVFGRKIPIAAQS